MEYRTWNNQLGGVQSMVINNKARRLGTSALRVAVIAVVLLAHPALGQQTPAAAASGAVEFPVFMQQNVAAGKTPAGTQVQAKLVIATLVNRTVIPEGAILSGRVIESMAMSANTPSRLAIYMDSARWKAGSAAIKVYLTAWYYPLASESREEEPTPSSPSGMSRNGNSLPRAGRSRTAPPADDTDTARISASRISDHRLLMKDVESARDDTGALTLTSSHSNLRLDKLTVYVLAPDTLLPPK
ncbi:MAG: hypothetical protein WAL71_16450 [Terriglobales bacterium]